MIFFPATHKFSKLRFCGKLFKIISTLIYMKELMLNDDLLAEILDYAKTKGLSYGTLKLYAINLRALFKKYDKLDRENLLKILKQSKHPQQRAILSLINEYCFYADLDFKIVIPKRRSQPRKLPEVLTVEEIKKMIEATPHPHDLMLRCIFGIGAGLRVQEVIKLSWNHFYWAEWLKERGDGIVMIKETKRGKNNINNVPREIMEALYDYAKELDILNEFFIPDKGVVFDFGIGEWNQELFSYNKEIWKAQYIKHAYDWIRHNIVYKHCCPAIGRRIKVHWLRHSRASYLLEVEKIPLERISKLMGHSSIQTTMIYTHLNTESTINAMKDVKAI